MADRKNIFYIGAILFIVIFAVYLRLNVYIFDRPLWMDECSLFQNIYELRYIDLFGKLRYLQTAPPIFLAIEKFIISTFGIKEMIIRILPFLGAIISVPVFYKFSTIFLERKISLIIANLLFAINFQLIFYTQEFKQYSIDVLLVMVLFIFLYNITIDNINKNQTILYNTVIPLFPLLSIPTYFILAGWFLRELFCSSKKNILKLFIIQIPLFLTSILYYFITLRPQHDEMYKAASEVWRLGFLTVNPGNIFELACSNSRYFFDPCNHPIAVIVLCVIGFITIIRHYNRKNNLFLICTLCSIIICSILELYPIKDRVALYIIPIIIVIIAKNFDFVSFKHKIYSFILISVFVFAFESYNIAYFQKCINNDYWRYQLINPKILMQKLKKIYKPNDIVYVYFPSFPEYQYYKIYYNFNPTEEVVIYPPKSASDYEKILTNVTKKSGNCWFYYSNEWNWEPYIFGTTILKKWKDKNNYTTLYEYQEGISYLLHLKK